MLDELIRNMLLAFAAALLVNLLLLANIVTCLLVLMCVVMTMVSLLTRAKDTYRWLKNFSDKPSLLSYLHTVRKCLAFFWKIFLNISSKTTSTILAQN